MKDYLMELCNEEQNKLVAYIKDKITVSTSFSHELEPSITTIEQVLDIGDIFADWNINTHKVKTPNGFNIVTEDASLIINVENIAKWAKTFPFYNRKKLCKMFVKSFYQRIPAVYKLLTNNEKDKNGNTFMDYLTSYYMSNSTIMIAHRNDGVIKYAVSDDTYDAIVSNFCKFDSDHISEITSTLRNAVDGINEEDFFDPHKATYCEIYIHELVNWAIATSLGIISPDVEFGLAKYNPFIK